MLKMDKFENENDEMSEIINFLLTIIPVFFGLLFIVLIIQ